MQLFGQIAGLLDQGRDNTLPVLALDFGQHHKPGMALHECGDVAVGPHDQLTLPCVDARFDARDNFDGSNM